MKHLKQLTSCVLAVCMTASLVFGGAAARVTEAAEVGAPVISILPETESSDADSPEALPGSISLVEIGTEAAGTVDSQSLTPVRAILRYPEPAVTATPGLVPCVPFLEPGEDLCNVVNRDQFGYEYFSDEAKNALQTNQFYVTWYNRDGGGGYPEFYELYESNRYWKIPNFVTVDSLMHTYHLYFTVLMRKVEKEMLSPRLQSLSRIMLEKCRTQYEALKGTEWENAARRNVAYFTIGLKLQAPDTEADAYVADIVARELDKIYAAAEISPCLLFEGSDSFYSGTHDEAYTQYKPRGNYEGDPVLEAYFRAMMWYGRITFLAEDEDATRSALLIASAMDEVAGSDWEPVYAVSSFFAGSSDDLLYYDYMSAADEVWASGVNISALPGDTASFASFREAVGRLAPPKINSLASHKGAEQDDSGKGFRFMGQRYNIDGEIYERLTEWDPDANLSRIIPDALDVPNALGSPIAEELMVEKGDALKPIYRDNLPVLREEIQNADDAVWQASLYAGWLHTLSPLLQPRPEGYPAFATNKEWLKKTLETYEGSYTELKHDTVLYAKQVYVAEGDGESPKDADDRGYVEPEPEVYARFASLAMDTRDGLERFGMLNDENRIMLEDLYNLAVTLLDISEKELTDQGLTEEEYDLIRNYGEIIEGYWEAYRLEMYSSGLDYATQLDASLVTDIASGDNWVLELGTGLAQQIVVIVPVDGTLRLATGTVYSFYEFVREGTDRLTDSEWKSMNGFRYGPDSQDPNPVDKPDWTMSYRVNPSNW